jgi:hypothetical protein
MTRKRDLANGEDAAWAALCDLMESLGPGHLERPGYSTEGWSVKDLVAHIGCWCAEAGRALEQMRFGTYIHEKLDIDALNREFYEANRDLPFPIVEAECVSARTRMLVEWNALPEVTPTAEEWFSECGEVHYGEHLPRLREWAGELRSSAPAGP